MTTKQYFELPLNVTFTRSELSIIHHALHVLLHEEMSSKLVASAERTNATISKLNKQLFVFDTIE